jgi:putative oxidoreductase
MEHGLMKMFHFPTIQPGVPVPLPPMLTAAAVIEIAGGILLTLGLLTRVAAFVCAGQMAFAYLIAHLSVSVWPGVNGGSEAILYCFIFLYLVFAGGGVWSIDARRSAIS